MAPRSKTIEPAKVLSIIDVCQHEQLFAPWFKDRESWTAWFTFLRVMFGLSLDAAGLALFQQCTGRTEPSPSGYLEVSLIIGRRGGKSLILALIAAYLSCFYNWMPYLTGGERAVVMVIAADRRQAGIIFKYLKAFLAIGPLKSMVQRETATELDLNNGVTSKFKLRAFGRSAGARLWPRCAMNWRSGCRMTAALIPMSRSWQRCGRRWRRSRGRCC
jgi:hypothetical protein